MTKMNRLYNTGWTPVTPLLAIFFHTAEFLRFVKKSNNKLEKTFNLTSCPSVSITLGLKKTWFPEFSVCFQMLCVVLSH